MSRVAFILVCLTLCGPVAAADLVCTFAMQVGKGSFEWSDGSAGRLRADDTSRVRPLDCRLPLIGARQVVEHGIPRYAYEFDASGCRGQDQVRYRVSARVTLVVYPAQGERGLLFWQDVRTMDECVAVQLGPSSVRAAKEGRP